MIGHLGCLQKERTLVVVAIDLQVVNNLVLHRADKLVDQRIVQHEQNEEILGHPVKLTVFFFKSWVGNQSHGEPTLVVLLG